MYLTISLNTFIFVLYRNSRFLEKCSSSQGKPPGEKGQCTSLPTLHTHILLPYGIHPSASHPQAPTLPFLFPLTLLPSALSSFLLTYIHQFSHFLVPYSLFSLLFTHNFCLSLKSGPRESLSLDSYTSLSLSLVASDIYVPSTNYHSNYERHF